MRKGELRRGMILDAAERLFFERGYDATSVQDILDELHLSKGGFYHHFTSKEAILEEICLNHVSTGLDEIKWISADQRTASIQKLNAILKKVNLLERDETNFAALLLKVCYVMGDVRLRETMRGAVIRKLQPHLTTVIESGIVKGDFFTRHRGHIAGIVLGVASDAADESLRILSKEPENPERMLDILDILNAGRDSVELLLGAPTGSVELFTPDQLVARYRLAAEKLLQLEGKQQ